MQLHILGHIQNADHPGFHRQGRQRAHDCLRAGQATFRQGAGQQLCNGRQPLRTPRIIKSQVGFQFLIGIEGSHTAQRGKE